MTTPDRPPAPASAAPALAPATAPDSAPADRLPPAGAQQETGDTQPVLTLRAGGATVRLALRGAQVFSFVAGDGDDVFWTTPAPAPLPAALRGGVPLCWPWFARHGVGPEQPQHGLVRQTAWRCITSTAQDGSDASDTDAAAAGASERPAAADHSAADGSNAARAVLEPVQPPDPDLHVRLEVVLDDALTLRLTTTNTGRSPRTLTQALHNYFRVGDVRRIGIDGLQHTTYADSLDHGRAGVTPDPVSMPLPCDRIHTGTAGHYAIDDPVLQRRIVIDGSGSASAVLWNPGPQAAQTLVDVPDGSWREFVCLEVANVGDDAVVLPPGASHTLAQRIGVQPLPDRSR